MYEKLIKEWIISNEFRVYALLAARYYQMMEELKPTLFRKWLASDLQIEEDKININSLYSALSRERRKRAKNEKKKIIRNETAQIQKTSFPFSKDDELPQKQNIVEL